MDAVIIGEVCQRATEFIMLENLKTWTIQVLLPRFAIVQDCGFLRTKNTFTADALE